MTDEPANLDTLIAELRKKADAATPGPWTVEANTVVHEEVFIATVWNVPDDGTFIAAARTLVPALLDALELARSQRDELIYDYTNVIDYYGTAATQAEISAPRIANADAELAKRLRGET